jgi:hypothetical protein
VAVQGEQVADLRRFLRAMVSKYFKISGARVNTSRVETVMYLINKNYGVLILINIKNCTY